MPLDTHLARRGFLPKQKKCFFARIWHLWFPRKVLTMIWLILIDNLLVEAWIKRIGHHGNYILYKTKTIETSKHIFSLVLG
jgi:hypothetical protein